MGVEDYLTLSFFIILHLSDILLPLNLNMLLIFCVSLLKSPVLLHMWIFDWTMDLLGHGPQTLGTSFCQRFYSI